jgi:hypothetical protein
MNAGRTPVCYLLCENGGRASSQRVQSANSTEPESGTAATRPLPQPLFSGSPNYAGKRFRSKMRRARRPESQCDIGKFDGGAARNVYFQRCR